MRTKKRASFLAAARRKWYTINNALWEKPVKQTGVRKPEGCVA